jgi:epoxyqueuosine reductase
MPSPITIRDQLAERAASLGFIGFGVASAVSQSDERDRLFRWLTSGYHASMSWMARNAERRADLQQVLPGAKSVISVAMNYYHPHTHNECCGDLKVSRYAWGDDYHDIVGERLGQLTALLDEIAPGSKSLTYVDTGPVMEKAIAERAGLGWIGKNACLITRDHGSWVFLGEIITTAELPIDEPHSDFCGSCSRCIDACPTDAFPSPYVIDAGKCISYWTIEHRGDIPEELSAHFDGWIFGCDICQDVCPWNKFAVPSEVEEFAPGKDRLCPPAERWTNLTPAEFKAEFANSPILRTKVEGLARNIRSQSADLLQHAVRDARVQILTYPDVESSQTLPGSVFDG